MSTAPASLSARADLVLAPPRRRLQPVALLALPGAGYLALAFAAPLALLLMASVISEGRPTLAGYRTFLADSFSWTVMANTIRSAGLITLICLVAGYPAAYYVTFRLRRGRNLALFLIVVSLFTSYLVRLYAWDTILGSHGVINTALIRLTESGLVLGAVNVFLPFMVLPIFSVVKLIDPRLLDAAATLGSSPLHRFFRVTLPLTMPGVIAGVAFVFSMSVSMYVIPTLLMGDRFKTLSVLIARSFLFMRDRSVGSTASVMLLLIAVAVVVASALLTRRWQPSR